MSRDTYDVDEPGPRPEPNPPDHGPACPHCGGGPLVLLSRFGAHACQSCARVVSRRTP